MRKEGIVRAAGVVGLGTFFSRILGLVRLQVIAYIFGYSAATDAFWIAFTLPNLLRSLLAEGALSTAFIPVLSEWLTKKGKDLAYELVNNVLNILILLLVGLVALGVFLAPRYVPCIAFGFPGDSPQLALAVRLTQVMFPFLIFISLAAMVMATLNCRGHFAAPAFAPVLFSITVISSAILLHRTYGIYSLAIGVVAGGGAQLLFQIPPLIRRGFSYRFALSFNHPGVRKIGRLIGPATLGGIALQANIIINRIFASTLPTGSISALQYAMRLIQFPLGLFAIAVSTAIFPALSSLAAEKNMGELRRVVSLGVRMVLLVLIPSTLGLIIIRKSLISLLFEHGAFLAQDSLITAQALLYYALGLLAMGEVMVLNRAFYSLQEIFVPVKVSLFVLFLNVLLNFLLISPLKHSGLALATSISMICNMIILLVLLRRRIEGLEGKIILASFWKICLVSILMAGGVYFVLEGIPPLVWISATSSEIIRVSAAIGTGGLIFFLLASLLRIEEFKVVLRAFGKKVNLKSRQMEIDKCENLH